MLVLIKVDTPTCHLNSFLVPLADGVQEACLTCTGWSHNGEEFPWLNPSSHAIQYTLWWLTSLDHINSQLIPRDLDLRALVLGIGDG
jgi:hypothetical protein